MAKKQIKNIAQKNTNLNPISKNKVSKNTKQALQAKHKKNTSLKAKARKENASLQDEKIFFSKKVRQRQERIKKAALELFLSKGYENTNLKDII